jgi:hypothetical protein
MPDVNDEATGLLAAHKATDLEDEVEAGTTDSTPKIAAGEELKSDDTPTIDPYEKKNIAIVLSYFCVGFGMTFIGAFDFVFTVLQSERHSSNDLLLRALFFCGRLPLLKSPPTKSLLDFLMYVLHEKVHL